MDSRSAIDDLYFPVRVQYDMRAAFVQILVDGMLVEADAFRARLAQSPSTKAVAADSAVPEGPAGRGP
jgi:hypothetical protein